MIRVFWGLLVLIIPFSVFPQPAFPKKYPLGYFRNPLNIPISLAANFGELRADHYHMGLDIRTQNKLNLPVFAAAEGYIARISVQPFGYGQAIYINHPNGYTTVYGHLNAFFPELAAYIKKQQYAKESWQITMDLPPDLFRVKKGQLIAYSGNTGGSLGPHLHFEIRSTGDEVNLNPMLFGLAIADNTAPAIQRLAIYDGSRSVYEQSPRLLAVKKIAAIYSVMQDTVVLNTPKAGFAITAFDTQSGSANPNGIYQADLYDGNQWVIGFQMDAISYDNTRGINAHIDYKTKTRGGPWLQQLFQLPGYTNSIYRSFKGNGYIDISDGLVHLLRIEVKDAYGNAARLNFKVLYKENNQSILPMSGKMFYPLMLGVFEHPDCAFYLGEKSLYDSVHIYYSESPSFPKDISAVHRIGADFIPINEPMLVRIRPIRDFPILKKDKVLMQRFFKSTKEVSRVEWQGGWASARFRQFGNFQLILDDVAPVISAIGFKEGGDLKKANHMVIVVKDDHEIIKHFRALLDGHWIRFSNDKEKSFIYTFDEHCGAGNHELSITAEDEAGNMAKRIFHFTR